eukprot:TRINITY_DN26879_c0_g1_i1.p1 TRINITY_DN26879_c0_g1~~TRINITY_DN26879_c0_g1_i1.p1  ORF type:complete len:183 (+),score=57.27 TRINITY_DN26879_c0_g1_i1:150-698(+)
MASEEPSLPPVQVLNAADHAQFTDFLRPLIEAAPLVVDLLFPLRPFASYESLVDSLEAALIAAGKEKLVELINAHPRIGEKKTVLSTLSLVSVKEQGLDREPEDRAAMELVDQELAQLNRDYEAKFGFRFIVFVNGRPKPEILQVMKQRINRSAEEEYATAVPDMFAIMRSRINRLLQAYKA